jgi:hypothetical protein
MPSVLRRYTPPTCTLEIAAKGSPLSRWTSRPVLKQLRFQLSFDDPKLPPEQQVKVKGDRAQLEVLCETVESYVQQCLNQPIESIAAPSMKAPTKRRDADVTQATIPDTAGIRLEPSGLLSHDLWLGVLETESSGPVIKLSALQLFDLANALDEYASESMAIPSLNRPAWLRTSPGWAPIAAIAVLALGVSATVAKFVIDVSSPTAVQTASTTGTEESSDPLLSPSAPTDEFPNVANLPDASKTTPPPLGNLEPLPPPPAPGTTQPAPPSLPSVVVPQRPTLTAPPQAATRIAPPPASPSPAPQPQASTPAPTQAPVTLSLPSEGSGAAGSAESQATGEAARSPLAGIQDIPTEQNQTTQQAAARGTAFDSIPQIAEVRGYFQERWQPPEGLTQTLEYRLVLNSDGSIQQITPLGQAAGTYVDRTNMPLIGERFVSPVEGGQTPQIRLVLRPDGGVQTFADPAN